MVYTITGACIKCELCADTCPVSCIDPTSDEPEFARASRLYIDPERCAGCGSCVHACPMDAVYPVFEPATAPAPLYGSNGHVHRLHPLLSESSHAMDQELQLSSQRALAS